jgi:hypothetical protein
MKNMNLIDLYNEYREERARLIQIDRISANLHIDNIAGYQGNAGYTSDLITHLAKEALENLKDKFSKEIHYEMLNIIDKQLNKIKE